MLEISLLPSTILGVQHVTFSAGSSKICRSFLYERSSLVRERKRATRRGLLLHRQRWSTKNLRQISSTSTRQRIMEPPDINLMASQACKPRRRSTVLTKQVLQAITETDDETFDDTLHYDFVALGGGVAAGYWAKAISASQALNKHTVAIISGDPVGLVPFERPALSKSCLDPDAEKLRDFSSSPSSFPFVCQGSGGDSQPPDWYEKMDITILSGCQAVSVDLDEKYIKVKRVLAGSHEKLLFGETIKVTYHRVLIATGARPRRIGDGGYDSIARGLQQSCFCSRHPDIVSPSLACIHPEQFGFGSVHYLRDLGDVVKLLQAMTRVEDDGQETCEEPAVIVGAGFIACEVAAAMSVHCPGMPVVMVVPGEVILEKTGFGKEICHFYEKQVARAGVIFAKGYRATRLWDIEEEGMFPTLERSSQSSTMKKTFPRVFGPVDPHFTRCRGVVLRNKQDEEVWLAARFVVVGIGSTPNSELFRASLDISSDGGIITDSSLRTSHASGDVFAAGDVACVPISLGREVDENLSPIIMRSEHVGSAQSMGTHAAGVMLGSAHANTPYNPVPFMYSRFLEVSWKFYGFARGELCVLGMDNFSSTRTFGGFWILGGRIVGVFLEEGPCSEADHSATLEYIARVQPRVVSTRSLRKCPLDRLLVDPHCLEPPALGVGEFYADTDEASMEEVFRKYGGANNTVKTAELAGIMQELGADWDADELSDAMAALDPSDSGFVELTTFSAWWTS